MSASALAYLTPGSEETEAVTTIDLLIRGDIKVTTANIASDDNLTITCSRGMKLPADALLIEVVDGKYDVIVLPDGTEGAECFRDSTLLVEAVKQLHRFGHIVTAICAAPVTVLVPHGTFPIDNTTGFPTLEDKIPAEQQRDRCVVWGARIKLLTSQGPEIAIDFGPKVIGPLVRRERAREVASQLVMAAGIYNYYEQCRMR